MITWHQRSKEQKAPQSLKQWVPPLSQPPSLYSAWSYMVSNIALASLDQLPWLCYSPSFMWKLTLPQPVPRHCQLSVKIISIFANWAHSTSSSVPFVSCSGLTLTNTFQLITSSFSTNRYGYACACIIPVVYLISFKCSLSSFSPWPWVPSVTTVPQSREDVVWC